MESLPALPVSQMETRGPLKEGNDRSKNWLETVQDLKDLIAAAAVQGGL